MANCKRVQTQVPLNMKTDKVEKVITTLKDRIGHPLVAPFRNLGMIQPP